MTTSRFGQPPLSLRNHPSRKRRPAGLSRRRKKQLGFETLEDRRVMSADGPLMYLTTSDDLYAAMQSYSSSTPDGALAILQQELSRYGQTALSTSGGQIARSLPTDPLFLTNDPDQPSQWHLYNTGQQVGNPDYQVIFGTPGEDINVVPVWNQDMFGDGVVVGVFEPGLLETTHPDLAANISQTLAYIGQGTLTDGESEAHATAVAGLIGAVADNNIGGIGVAPGAVLVPMSAAGVDPQVTADGFRYALENGIDIVNNSWGPPDTRQVAGPTQLEILALRDNVFFGRDGLGTILVWAAGNGADTALDSSSYDGYVSSRYTIGVTGVDHSGQYNNIDGTVTGYPETGASVLVAAPTGSVFLDIVNDTGIGSGIVTTDTTGDEGFNILPDPDTGEELDRDFLDDVDYTSRFNGTSASTPIVSGVIALMLQMNPNLSWRDVQEILLRSARQNSPTDTLGNGVDTALGVEFQSTWIINQVPLFHDPDAFNPLLQRDWQILNPILDPQQTGTAFGFGLDTHYAPTPQVLTNGAGYTVSQGRGTNNEQIGFAHGVVDAELAVQLAQQWHTKNQVLPNELTFTTELNGAIDLPAAEVVNDVLGPNSDDLIVPGGLGGEGGFGAYWVQFLAPNPNFNQAFNARGIPIELTVPDSNNMTIEHMELTIDLDPASGSLADFLDNVRVVLVSPSGTYSDLNHYFIDPSFDDSDFHQVEFTDSLLTNGLNGVTVNDVDYVDAGTVDNGLTTITFSTNRNWGERYDDALIFDPTTGEPIRDIAGGAGGNRFNGIPSTTGDLMTQGWQLYMENYSPVDFTINAFELAWHGSPIGANTYRIQGLIGVDDNGDDAFNYSRVVQTFSNIDSDPTTTRLGEVVNLIDPDHESMASNVTVSLRRASDNVLVDQFVTGADGNYYFDVVPGNYIVSIEDPLGRSAKDDSLTPSGLLQDYQSEWHITSDYFNVWDYDSNLEVPISPSTGAPVSFLDGSGSPVQYGMKNINFLLDPGPAPAEQVDFSGMVYADTNGDGLFNSNDVALPNARVYGDVNRNGQFDAGEIFTTTDASGQYLLTVPLLTATSVINVGVIPPANWTASNPASGFQSFFVNQGDVISAVDFYVQPPATTVSGDGTLNSGVILGYVFNDINGDGVRQSNEMGVINTTVYIDMNNSGAIDAGDVVTQTNANGAYVFAGVPDGSHFIRLSLDPALGLNQTFPMLNLPQSVTVTAGGTVPNVRFGVRSPTTGGSLDYGDLPDVYGTTTASNGPRHPKGIFYLGSSVDSETNGVPSSDALGDDNSFTDDEDGVTVDPLVAGGVGRLEVVASRYGGYFQGWIDFNGDGDFNDIIGGVSEQIVVNNLLDPGLNVLTFAIPATIDAATVYARFRYGEFGLGPLGLAQVGEVEDYVLDKAAPAAPLIVAHGPDFNSDGEVSGSDFLAWQRNAGKTTNATPYDGDSDGDGDVDRDDLADWEDEYGASAASGGGGALAAVQSEESDPSAQLSEASTIVAPQLGVAVQAPSSTDSSEQSTAVPTDSDAGQSSASLAVSSTVQSPSPTVSTLETTAETASLESAAAPVVTSRSSQTDFLTSLGSEAQRRFQQGHRIDRKAQGLPHPVRVENRTVETSFRDSVNLADLAFVVRDRVLDRLFARHEKLLEELPWHCDGIQDEPSDILETVLGEETEWRFV